MSVSESKSRIVGLKNSFQLTRALRGQFRACLAFGVGSLALWLCASATAQTYSIDWHTIDSGGGTGTGGVYAVSGTIGQPDAGAMSVGSFTLQGGFWSMVAAVQTPDAPLLSITFWNGNAVVSWPLPATGFVLDESPVLEGNPPPWSQVSIPYQTNATRIFISAPGSVGNQFYRLRKL